MSKNERGFSLIELMVASMLFLVGALGLLRLMYSSSEGVTVAQKLTQATQLARTKLDELVMLPYDDAALAIGAVHEDGVKNLGPAGTSYTPSGGATGDFGGKDGWFARSWEVTEPVAGLKVITITVKWWDGPMRTFRQVHLVGGMSQ
ncbi:MAG: prepilin-type N-terminal cleavage/methylation domain-containing protein [Deltaproteobacteria bacterium]|nr:prepilin-type N-terminal cleavage/methylation domain-containing protein [Deltaproteobacteria bacterium]